MSASISTGIWLLPRQVGQHAEFVGILRGPELAPANMRDLCRSTNRESLKVGSRFAHMNTHMLLHILHSRPSMGASYINSWYQLAE
jgi:hypothetical protein